jgi:hypothetical protein
MSLHIIISWLIFFWKTSNVKYTVDARKEKNIITITDARFSSCSSLFLLAGIFCSAWWEKKTERERKRNVVCHFAIFFAVFFSPAPSTSICFYQITFSLSLCLPYFFLKVFLCINVRCFIIILLTANNTPMVWLLISFSFFFDFEGYLIVPFFFSLFDLSIARD